MKALQTGRIHAEMRAARQRGGKPPEELLGTISSPPVPGCSCLAGLRLPSPKMQRCHTPATPTHTPHGQQPLSCCFLSPIFSSARLPHFCKFVLRSLYQRSWGLFRDTNCGFFFFFLSDRLFHPFFFSPPPPYTQGKGNKFSWVLQDFGEKARFFPAPAPRD